MGRVLGDGLLHHRVDLFGQQEPLGDKRFRGPSRGGAGSGSNPVYKLLKGEPVCNVYLANNREAVSIEIVS